MTEIIGGEKMRKLKAVVLITLIVAFLVIIPAQAEARLDEEKYGDLARGHNQRMGYEQEAATGTDFIAIGVVLLIALGIAVWLIRRKHIHAA